MSFDYSKAVLDQEISAERHHIQNYQDVLDDMRKEELRIRQRIVETWNRVQVLEDERKRLDEQ